MCRSSLARLGVRVCCCVAAESKTGGVSRCGCVGVVAAEPAVVAACGRGSTSPRHAALHGATPHRTAPHRTAPHRTAPHHATPRHATPRHAAPKTCAPSRNPRVLPTSTYSADPDKQRGPQLNRPQAATARRATACRQRRRHGSRTLSRDPHPVRDPTLSANPEKQCGIPVLPTTRGARLRLRATASTQPRRGTPPVLGSPRHSNTPVGRGTPPKCGTPADPRTLSRDPHPIWGPILSADPGGQCGIPVRRPQAATASSSAATTPTSVRIPRNSADSKPGKKQPGRILFVGSGHGGVAGAAWRGPWRGLVRRARGESRVSGEGWCGWRWRG
ncbi:hypothetical protein DFR70_101484 [Nocardia tenerifensis]|uniref:Uncharacterized protein n=1 Tax=Nocardia tenerifensis TaxID=228006 RepID=A0A318KFQ7_9NOCA|nr:hypothetical protein DFR70_101484 [Nocardia tenerifensis]